MCFKTRQASTRDFTVVVLCLFHLDNIYQMGLDHNVSQNATKIYASPVMWIHPKSKESWQKSKYRTTKPLFDQVIAIYCENGPMSEQNILLLKDRIKYSELHNKWACSLTLDSGIDVAPGIAVVPPLKNSHIGILILFYINLAIAVIFDFIFSSNLYKN